MRAAERISQLGGEPHFDPATIAGRAHTTYETHPDGDLEGILRDNLTAERIAITTYQEIIRWLGDGDPTTRRLLEDFLADEEDEEEHADDIVDLLGPCPAGACRQTQMMARCPRGSAWRHPPLDQSLSNVPDLSDQRPPLQARLPLDSGPGAAAHGLPRRVYAGRSG
jgi:hypothetical protein